MSEGGQLPWKRQSIDEHRGPAGDYAGLRDPLPPPPLGVGWSRDPATGDWALVRTSGAGGGGSLPTPLPVRGGGGGGGGAADPATDSETGTDDDDGEGRPSAPPAEGVDYVLHKVLPTDTFQGLCLRYRIRPHVLRRCNGFSGTNLHLAPSTLVVPLGPGGELLGGGPVLRQNRTTPEYKLQALREEFPHLRRPECRAYLEMADWSLEGAREAAAEDDDWEEGQENEGWKKGEREEKGETEPLVTAD